jgi:cell division protein FtsW
MGLRKIPDPWLFITTGVLAIFGLLMVGSASSYVAMLYWGSPLTLFFKQCGHLVLGLALLIAAMNYPYRRLNDSRVMQWAFVACLVLLVLVFFFPGAGGAHRWVGRAPLRFQPSELTKLFVILFMARVLSKEGNDINDLKRVALPALAVVATLIALIVIEPDLGSAVVIAAVAVVMAFVACLRAKYIGALVALGGIGATIAILMEPFRIKRVKDFILGLIGLQEPSYQIWQARIAFGNGGGLGQGFGQGQQKAFFVPAAHTDFIYAILGEEFGLLGALALLAAFLIIMWRGLRTARNIRDPFGGYLALGCTSLIVIQAMMHICICLGFLPTTGLPLPFISYGGSSLLVSMAAMGLLLNVSQECNLRPKLIVSGNRRGKKDRSAAFGAAGDRPPGGLPIAP